MKTLQIIFYFFTSILLFVSCGSESNSTKLQEVKFLNGKIEIKIPAMLTKDEYYQVNQQSTGVRYKTKDDQIKISVRDMPKLSKDLSIFKAMMGNELKEKSKNVENFKSEIKNINGQEFYFQQASVDIDGIPHFRQDLYTFLNDKRMASINISCYEKAYEGFKVYNEDIINSIKVNLD